MLFFENQFPSNPLTIGALSLIIIFCVLFSCLTVLPVSGQEAVGLNKIKPLQIGDTIPEELWDMPMQVINHPEGKDTIALNDYRGKLIILDFWATWCGSCVKAFPKLDSLNFSLKEDIQFVLVNSIEGTGDSYEKVGTFISNLESAISLPFVVNDKVLKQVFPRKFIPHYVWIGKEGVVRAITSSQEVTRDNIFGVVDGRNVELKLKEH